MEFARTVMAKSVFNPGEIFTMPGLILPVRTRYATSKFAFAISKKNRGRYARKNIHRFGLASLKSFTKIFRAANPAIAAITMPAMISSVPHILPLNVSKSHKTKQNTADAMKAIISGEIEIWYIKIYILQSKRASAAFFMG